MLFDEVNKMYLIFACLIDENFKVLNQAFQATNPDPNKLFEELEEFEDVLLKTVYKKNHSGY